MNFSIFMLSTLISLVGVLLSVAFFTLLERKVMGLMHFRKGPNKVILSGVTQPMSDAMKLLTKENNKMTAYKKVLFSMGPTLALALMLLCWVCFPPQQSNTATSGKALFIVLSAMSLSAFVFFMTGWGSNSKYALLGSYRAVSQIISYEVCLILLILCVSYAQNSVSFSSFKSLQESWAFMCLCPPLFCMWMLMCLSESNRTPFDHAESESELVSGFNVEYGGGLFALIFIAEYGMIMFLSFLTSMVFLTSHMVLLKTMAICFVFIWARCSFPRLRYDKLMPLCWKLCLPYSLSLMSLALFF